MIDCPYCASPIPEVAIKCAKCAEYLRRSVGPGLAIGIFFLPGIFSWFTLRAGYSRAARLLSFGYLSLSIGLNLLLLGWVLAPTS